MIRGLLLAAGVIAAVPGPALAQPGHAPQSKAHEASACFNLSDSQGDKPINEHTVLFRVAVSDIYALDFANGCPELTYPDPKLILTPIGGNGFICHAIDLDVKVGMDGPGDIPVPCIPTGLRKLTPAEIAALPKKDLP
jgi:hypothetical protein